jgi:3',5'-cyclic AMP phosphodiesterase CpdA
MPGMCCAAQYGGLLPNLTINTNNTQQQAAAQTGNQGSIMNPNGNYPFSTFGFNQFSWFLNDIGRVDRGRTPWVIVAWHQPPYNSYSTHYKEFECGRLMIEPYLYANGVDIIMHGHVHAYERTYPINNYNVDQCGSRWITIGDGGNIEGLYKTFASQAGTSPCVAINNATYSNGCAVQSVAPSTLPQARAALLHGLAHVPLFLKGACV